MSMSFIKKHTHTCIITSFNTFLALQNIENARQFCEKIETVRPVKFDEIIKLY